MSKFPWVITVSRGAAFLLEDAGESPSLPSPRVTVITLLQIVVKCVWFDKIINVQNGTSEAQNERGTNKGTFLGVRSED